MPLTLNTNQSEERRLQRPNVRPVRRRNALLPNSRDFARLQAFGEVYHEERGGAVEANVEVSSNNFRSRVDERVRELEQERVEGGRGGEQAVNRDRGRETHEGPESDDDGSDSDRSSEGPET